MSVDVVVRMLLDRDRLAVAGTLAARDATVDELVERTGRDRKTVLSALGDLRSAGVVTLHDARYRLDAVALRDVASAWTEARAAMDPSIGFGMTDEERTVLARYFEGRRLQEIPSSHGKRLVVLQRLALEFEIGRRYREPDVDAMLGAFHPDYAALRRYLVDAGLLDREHVDGTTMYWRSGGRVDVAPG